MSTEPEPPYKACVWCGLPKYDLMDECEKCGEFVDLDHLREADGQHVCPDCETDLLYP